ncbi:MAG: 50S ribosomal protein L6 [Desulfobacteraceae bacterium]|jgi:large subunit ribosomal protein L6|nr:MAG: 50S ribosomal protein L6 [Desulfobacteraceae bacterium]
MSRVAKKPIPVPDKTKLDYKDRILTIQGSKGTLSRTIHPLVDLNIGQEVVRVTGTAETRESRALQGLTRSLVANMVTGVSKGFEKALEINGIGYRAELKGAQVVFHLGYSHPIEFDLPEGITASVERGNLIKISGIDKEKVGHTAAAIRRLRPPEPYKGKGIKYAKEQIRKKAGKTGTK